MGGGDEGGVVQVAIWPRACGDVLDDGSQADEWADAHGFSRLAESAYESNDGLRRRFGRNVENVQLLVRELKEFRATINTSGNTSFNAREGQHDDLVLALALAVFGALRPRPIHSIETRFAS